MNLRFMLGFIAGSALILTIDGLHERNISMAVVNACLATFAATTALVEYIAFKQKAEDKEKE